MAKKANTTEEAWEVQEKYDGLPHGWIQWKGTNACMDVHCKCGELFHIDSLFAYHVKCPHCGTVFMCNGHIEIIELEIEPDHCVVTGDDFGGVLKRKPH